MIYVRKTAKQVHVDVYFMDIDNVSLQYKQYEMPLQLGV